MTASAATWWRVLWFVLAFGGVMTPAWGADALTVVEQLTADPSRWSELQPNLADVPPAELDGLLEASADTTTPYGLVARRVIAHIVRSATGARQAAWSQALADHLSAEPAEPAVQSLVLDLLREGGTREAVHNLEVLLVAPAWRELARMALIAIGGPEAIGALRHGLQAAILGRGETAWVDSLVYALGHARDAEALPLMVQRLQATERSGAEAAIAALRVLGDARAIPPLETVWREGQPELRDEAMAALLDLAAHAPDPVAMATRVRDWLAAGLPEHQHCAALSALARLSGAAAVDRLTADLDHPSLIVRGHARSLLAALPGAAAQAAILAAAPTATPRAQADLVHALAGRDPAISQPILADLLQSPDEQVRAAVIDLWSQQGAPDAIEPLVDRHAEEGTWLRGRILRTMLLIGRRAIVVDAGQAREIFLRVLHLAAEPRDQIGALQALALVATPDLWSEVRHFLHGETRAVAASTALAIGDSMVAGGQQTEAIALFAAVTEHGTRDQVTAAASKLAALGVLDEPARHDGFLTRWWLLGSIPSNDLIEPSEFARAGGALDPAVPVTAGERLLRWRWQPISDPTGACSLLPLWQPTTDCFAYAYTELTVTDAQPAELFVGSDDSVTVWLNGTTVHDHDVERPLVIDQDKVDIELQQGLNRLLVRIGQEQGDWGFSVRLRRPQGDLVDYEPIRPPQATP